jgi:hypothetical protein
MRVQINNETKGRTDVVNNSKTIIYVSVQWPYDFPRLKPRLGPDHLHPRLVLLPNGI